MEGLGNAKLDFLKIFPPFKNGVPSHDTFRTVFANLDARQFNEIFVKRILSFQKKPPNHVAIDGKTVQRSKMELSLRRILFPHGHRISGLFWDSLNLKENTMKSRQSPNRSMLALKGALVAIDAMGRQKDIAEKIVNKKAAYLLAVKRNQNGIFENIQTAFKAAESGAWPVELPERKTVDKVHGRIENRTRSIITQPEPLSAAEDMPAPFQKNLFFINISCWEI